MTGDVGNGRLARQLSFVMEVDKVKSVLRETSIVDASRRENDAEHMWHLAVMALVLAEHAAEPIDVGRVIELVLLHDIVEIDAGDVFVYDEEARLGKAAAERAAADRIYGLLPEDVGARLRERWEEFEEGATPEARFGRALDRLQPLLLNHASGGRPWLRHGVTEGQVRGRNAPIGEIAPALWEAASEVIDTAVAEGLLRPATAPEARPAGA